MAIDSAEKRRSISGIHFIGGPGVTPNSGKDQEWRQEVGYGYSGIAAAGGPAGGGIRNPFGGPMVLRKPLGA